MRDVSENEWREAAKLMGRKAQLVGYAKKELGLSHNEAEKHAGAAMGIHPREFYPGGRIYKIVVGDGYDEFWGYYQGD